MNGTHRLVLLLWCAALVCLSGAAGPAAAPPAAPVAMIRIEGAIDVPTAEYLERSLEQAHEQGAQCLLVLVNTPGGLGSPMLKMSRALLNAPLPTITYVYPAGGFAISAGTYIVLSGNIAAMHPATTIGGAHPVQLIPTASPQGQEGQDEKAKAAEASAMEEKILNTFAEQAKVIAKVRGRNAEWADQAVRESKVVSAEEALELNVVDLVASDIGDLLRQVDGRTVSLPEGKQVTLHTKGAPIVEIAATARERFLHTLANPDLLLVFLVLAGLGIMFELKAPGGILPGVIGGLCLLLALYSMSALPVSYAGVGLVAFGMLLLIAEVKVPSHGVLTVGGITSFALGAVLLMDTTVSPAIRVSWQVIVVMSVLMLLFFIFVVGAAISAHRRKVDTGEEGLRHEYGKAVSALDPTGQVLVEGELWRARAVSGAIREGEKVEVVGQEGLTLLVQRRAGETGTEQSSAN